MYLISLLVMPSILSDESCERRTSKGLWEFQKGLVIKVGAVILLTECPKCC